MVMTSVNQAVIEVLSNQIAAAYSKASPEQIDAAARERLVGDIAHALEGPMGRRTLATQAVDLVNAALGDWEAQEGRPFGLRLIEIDSASSTVTMG